MNAHAITSLYTSSWLISKQFNVFIFCFRSNLWLVWVVLYYLEYSLDLFKAIAIFARVCLTLWYGIRLLLTTGWGQQARYFHELLFCYLLKWSFRSLSNRVGSEQLDVHWKPRILCTIQSQCSLFKNEPLLSLLEAYSQLFKGWRAVSIG